MGFHEKRSSGRLLFSDEISLLVVFVCFLISACALQPVSSFQITNFAATTSCKSFWNSQTTKCLPPGKQFRRRKSRVIMMLAEQGEEQSERTSLEEFILSRRSWLTLAATTASLFPSATAALEVEEAAAGSTTEDATTRTITTPRIIKLVSGIQYSDARIGQGPQIQKDDIILLHLRALKYDGTILFDTKMDGDGRPLLHRLGSKRTDYDALFLSGSNNNNNNGQQQSSWFFSQPAKILSKVTLGVEDAILSAGQGSWEGGFGKVEPMNQGGIRLVVVPGALAYGNAGVSRYDAMRMGLRSAVPRDELLRYEVEILRCMEIELPGPSVEAIPLNEDGSVPPDEEGSRTFPICCTEDIFPCPTQLSDESFFN